MRAILTMSALVGVVGCSGKSASPTGLASADAGPRVILLDDAGSHGTGDSGAGLPDAAAIVPLDAGAVDAPAEAASVCPTTAPVGDIEDPSIQSCTTIVYIAGGDDNTLTVSTDGATWTSFEVNHQPNTDDFINFISVAQGVVTMTSLPGVYQSIDGAKTFKLASGVDNTMDFGTYGGEITAGNMGLMLTDNEATYLATDAVTWVVADVDAGGFGGHYDGTAFGAGVYMALQGNGSYRRYDGASFYDGTIPMITDSGPDGVAYGNGVFVVVAGGNAITSADARTWGAPTPFANGAVPSVVIFDGTKFLAYDGSWNGGEGGTVTSSMDGQTWTTPTPVGNGIQIDAAAYYGGSYFALAEVNNSGMTELLLSTDGFNWTVAHVSAANETYNIGGARVGMGRILK